MKTVKNPIPAAPVQPKLAPSARDIAFAQLAALVSLNAAKKKWESMDSEALLEERGKLLAAAKGLGLTWEVPAPKSQKALVAQLAQLFTALEDEAGRQFKAAQEKAAPPVPAIKANAAAPAPAPAAKPAAPAPAPAPAAKTSPAPVKAAPAAKPEAPAPAPAPAATEPAKVEVGRRNAISVELTAQLVWNPDFKGKRAGSKAAEKFEKYRGAATVEEYLKRGGTRSSLRWDLKHSIISIKK